MEIRKAHMGDLARILEIYASARAYMRENGNPSQWKNNYPARELVEQDIADGICHVCVEDGVTVGVFVCFTGEDPTYRVIEDGAWLNDAPYAVIHRIATDAHCKGVASKCFAYGFSLCGNLKIDTHEDNIPMQRALAKNGFVRCGIIHLQNGEARIAYQKAE